MTPSTATRLRSTAALLIGLLYAFAAFSMGHLLALRFASAALFDIVESLVRFVLLAAGFIVFGRILYQQKHPLVDLGWWWGYKLAPPDSKYFWNRPGGAAAAGGAIGWAMAVVLILPIALTGNLVPSLDVSAEAWRFTFTGLIASFLSLAVREMVFRGWALQRLAEVTSPTVASLLLAIGFGAVTMRGGVETRAELLFVMLQQLVLCAAALRTRNLWMPTMFAFALREVLLLGFGAPVGNAVPAGVISSQISGPSWLTGGFAGPMAAIVAPVVAVSALVFVVRVTRRDVIGEIRGAGYPVDLDASRAPNPVHAAYNPEPAAPQLVTILPAGASQEPPARLPE